MWRTWIVHPAAFGQPSGPWIHVDARTQSVRRVEYKSPWERRRQLGAGLLIAALVALIIILFFRSTVCDDELAQSGQVVSVCRHVQAGDPVVLAIGVVILAALGMFYSEVSGFGVSLKRKVDESAQTASAGLQMAKEVRAKTEQLEETAGDLADFNKEQVQGFAIPPEPAGVVGAEGLDNEVRRLAAEYNWLRGTMPSGRDRSVLMDETVLKLRRTLQSVDHFDVARYLAIEDRGIRLAAYAYLVDHPSTVSLQSLVRAAINEDKPFGQYWALKAIGHQMTLSSDQLNAADLAALSDLGRRAGAGTDRAQEISRIVNLYRE